MQGRIQDFFKRPRAKEWGRGKGGNGEGGRVGMGEGEGGNGGGGRVTKVRVMFEYVSEESEALLVMVIGLSGV